MFNVDKRSLAEVVSGSGNDEVVPGSSNNDVVSGSVSDEVVSGSGKFFFAAGIRFLPQLFATVT